MALTGKAITATSRLQQDYLRLKKDPVPYIVAEPLPSDICQWHYVIRGPEKTPYEGGVYHGKLLFPRQFPFKPPSIYMITPNGRFKTNTRLCLSISDFHPDTWNPAWSVATILTGLLSFMVEVTPTFGSIDTTDAVKRQFARKSLEFNLQDSTFCELFPDIVAVSGGVAPIVEQSMQSNKVRGENRRVTKFYSVLLLMLLTVMLLLLQLAGPNRAASLCKKIRVKRNKRKSGTDSSGDDSTNGDGDISARGRHQIGQNAAHSTLYSAITNVCVLIGFAAFVYSVKYVMRSLG